MAIALATKFAPYADEIFKTESKRALLTNNDFDWTGAHTVKVYKVSTVGMNDYARNCYSDDDPAYTALSRYGELYDLSATTEELLLSKDRSFIFNVDKLDTDETAGAVEAASALARQLRNVVIPEVDSYVYGKMVTAAGTKAAAKVLNATDIYKDVLLGSEALDDAEVPETERVLVVVPEVYSMIKQCTAFDHTEIGAEMRAQGVVGMLDGMLVIKVPAARLPQGFGFMIAHPSATCAPVKLESYSVHSDTPLASGDIVTGRIAYDAFVLENKTAGIYYQPQQAAGLTITSAEGSASGKTALTVSPEKGSISNIYKYVVDDEIAPIAIGGSVSSWTSWDGSADITAATGKVLTLVEADSNGKALKGGYVEVVAEA